MSGADDLFSSEAPVPIKDRLGRSALLLGFSLPLSLLGFTCFTGVPGAVLALVGWQMADEEVARVESGALPADRLPKARRLRMLGFSLLLFSIGAFVVQIALFSVGFYEGVLGAFIELIRSVV